MGREPTVSFPPCVIQDLSRDDTVVFVLMGYKASKFCKNLRTGNPETSSDSQKPVLRNDPDEGRQFSTIFACSQPDESSLGIRILII
jgi:hypothetical protein